MNSYSLTHLSDGTLLRDLATLVAKDRRNTAELLAHLAEVDARRLYAPAGYPSMLAYCTDHLRMSEDSALKRIQVARSAREYPILLDMLADGRLHLTGACLLAPHLTAGNVEQLTGDAAEMSKGEIKQMLAARHPQSEALPLVESVSTTVPESNREHAPAHVAGDELDRTSAPRSVLGQVDVHSPRGKMSPIARERFALHLTIGQETHDKLRRAEALLSHRISPGDLAGLLDRVLDLAIERLEKKKFAATLNGRRHSMREPANPRHVPSQVKREVWKRDEGHCTFVNAEGRRCTGRSHLEFDHVLPVAHGGKATVENIRLRCRTHNQYEAERALGANFMRRKAKGSHRAASRGRTSLRESSRVED